MKVDFLRASSYGSSSESAGDVQVKGTSTISKWDGHHILLVSLQQQTQVSKALCGLDEGHISRSPWQPVESS